MLLGWGFVKETGSMFRKEWMTVAMGNGKAPLKEKAKYITKNADEDGIYEACRHFGWI